MTNDKMKLSDASRRLNVPYMQLYHEVVSNKVPAERNAAGTRWEIQEKNLPAIAAALGVESPTINAA